MASTDKDLAERFERDGFVFPIDVMSRETAGAYRGQLEAWEARNHERKEYPECLRRYPNLVLPFIDKITRLPEITDPVAGILGPDLLVLDCPFFIKEAKTSAFVSWHQDLTYWGLEGDEEVTAWIALTPSTVESGCMRFVASSHAMPVAHHDTHDAENLLTRGQEAAVDVDEGDASEAILKPGQMSLHHGRVLHASHPNASPDRRIGLAVRYVSARMKQTPGSNMAAMLVRGIDRYGHFRPCRTPDEGAAGPDWANWAEIAGARNSVMMDGPEAKPRGAKEDR